jgi:hypothetical protein
MILRDSLCQVVDHKLSKNAKKSSSVKSGSRKRWKSGCGVKSWDLPVPRTPISKIPF